MAVMVAETEVILKLVLAAIAGGIIGFERGKIRSPAGMRTHMLVCLGSALFIIVTMQTLPGEAARIIGGVATGIGFLGAGTIFKAKTEIHGLTTAASIWAIAAVGVSIALGLYLIGFASVILILIILRLNRINYFREI